MSGEPMAGVCFRCGATMSVLAFECDSCKEHWLYTEHVRIAKRNARNAQIFSMSRRLSVSKRGR